MNKIILSFFLLGGIFFNLDAQTEQERINKYILDANKNQAKKKSENKITGDDGYLQKEDNGNDRASTPLSSSSKNSNSQADRKATKPIKTIIPKGAKVIHLKTSLEVRIPKGKYAILDFPFKITTFDFKGLKSIQAKKADFDLSADMDKIKNKAESPIDFEQKGNRIIINSKVLGSGQMIVWGGSYPVIINLIVQNVGIEYYSFIDTTNNNSDVEVKRLENREHQKVLNILSVALYRDKTPKGYEKIENRDIFNYKKENLQLVRSYTLIGKYYVAEKWFALNKDKKRSLNLYEEMFYMPDVYSVSILTDRVEPLKSTAILIIRKKDF
ncbi:hypothetical protein BKH42_03540 [Helicobacter sp. 13S00482-2]|uniref:hypothetical protein n=1 Tax=Helicobacter sp. 13S00482-2 TaxID=1476200 RepID=UPI000BA742D0|nr:hypothetical protein [Helicobacter sp. 13S00482-2]PAF53814.1 hypothetical protein BKH42_03540 [Helicobacter sp. 13S00482-2]